MVDINVILNKTKVNNCFVIFCEFLVTSTVKPVLSGHSKRRPKIGFQNGLLLNAGQKYCRMLSWSILQYFQPSLSYHLSLIPLFCLFLSGCLRQVLLYSKVFNIRHNYFEYVCRFCWPCQLNFIFTGLHVNDDTFQWGKQPTL